MTRLPIILAVGLLVGVAATESVSAQLASNVPSSPEAELPSGAATGTAPSPLATAAPPSTPRPASELNEVRELFESAFDRQAAAQERSTQYIMLFVGALFAGILGLAKLGFKSVERARTSALRHLDGLKRELERIDAAVKKLNEDLEHCRTLGEKVKGVQELEEVMADTIAGAEEAKLRVQFLSSDPREQLRAVEKASGSRNPRLVPFLKDVVRDQTDSTLVSEALYGLRVHAEHVAKDPEVVRLVCLASRHVSRAVRHEAIQCMREIDRESALFQARLGEMAEDEVDPPLKSEARRALEMPGSRRRGNGYAAE